LPLIHLSPFSRFLSGLQRYEKLLFIGCYYFNFLPLHQFDHERHRYSESTTSQSTKAMFLEIIPAIGGRQINLKNNLVS